MQLTMYSSSPPGPNPMPDCRLEFFASQRRYLGILESLRFVEELGRSAQRKKNLNQLCWIFRKFFFYAEALQKDHPSQKFYYCLDLRIDVRIVTMYRPVNFAK